MSASMNSKRLLAGLLAGLLLFTGCGRGGSRETLEEPSSSVTVLTPAAQETADAVPEEHSAEAPADADREADTAETAADEGLGESPEETPADQILTPEPAAEETAGPSGGTNERDSRREDAGAKEAEDLLAVMPLEDKVAQLFILTPDALTGVEGATAAGETTRQALDAFPVGGIICMGPNLEYREQAQDMLSSLQTFSRDRTGLPLFTFVDEEGGTVARISGQFADVPAIADMAVIGSTGDPEQAREVGETIGGTLADLGFNADFAPVADVLTDPYNTVIGPRSFGSDPYLVAEMASAAGQGLESQGVYAVYKHFPGHGNTAQDSHEGSAYTDKTLEELRACELIPFQAAVDNGASFIMTGHISLPQVTEADLPASLSYEITTELLREEMGFDGIVVTDALNMGAVADLYSSGEAAVLAIEAGADMLLMPVDAWGAKEALLEAVRSGRIPEERIDQSVRRILRVKTGMEQS